MRVSYLLTHIVYRNPVPDKWLQKQHTPPSLLCRNKAKSMTTYTIEWFGLCSDLHLDMLRGCTKSSFQHLFQNLLVMPGHSRYRHPRLPHFFGEMLIQTHHTQENGQMTPLMQCSCYSTTCTKKQRALTAHQSHGRLANSSS